MKCEHLLSRFTTHPFLIDLRSFTLILRPLKFTEELLTGHDIFQMTCQHILRENNGLNKNRGVCNIHTNSFKRNTYYFSRNILINLNHLFGRNNLASKRH